MIIYTLITLIFIECSAKININIETSSYSNRTKVNYPGTDIKLVTDKEINIFNITNNNLNKGVKLEMGKVPDDIFVRDPTPYDTLFKDYKWPEVSRKLTIENVKILEFMDENIVIKTHEHINNTTRPIKCKTDMSVMAEYTVISLWSEGLPDDLIIFGINIDFGFANWSFDEKWRDESMKYKYLQQNASKGDITLNSGKTIEIQLLVTKIIMLIEIEYVAILVGSIITDYENLYGKYHFYSPTIQDIMRAAKLRNEIKTRQYLELRYFTNPRIQILAKDSGKELYISKKKIWRKKGNNTYVLLNGVQ